MIFLLLLAQFAAGGRLSGVNVGVVITVPTTAASYNAGTASTITVSGTAASDRTITGCTWSDSLGGSGATTGTTTWSVASVGLTVGANVITVVCTNVAGTTSQVSITITRTSGSSNPIDASRRVDWSLAGIAGGIPSDTWSQCGSTIAAPSNSSAVISAIAACGTDQYVKLGVGTFTIDAGVQFAGRSHVELRGSMADQTNLNFTNDTATCHGGYGAGVDVCITASDTNWSGGPSHAANWTANYTKGTTTITLSSVTGLGVGWPLILDQANDASDTGGVLPFVCMQPSTTPPCSLEGDNGAVRTNRDQQQIVVVTGISGNNVTFTPGLYEDTWSSGKSPGAWWASNPITHVGLRDLTLDHTNSAGAKGVFITDCVECWMYGVRSINSGKAHVEIAQSAHTEIRSNYFYKTQSTTSQSYGIEELGGSDDLIINNILHYVTSPLMLNNPCEGCVIAYNFAINDFYTGSSSHFNLGSTNLHQYDSMVLWEGNDGGLWESDNFHGTHNFITSFRERIAGVMPVCANSSGVFAACDAQRIAVDLHAYSRYYNFVGDVIGVSGIFNGYQAGHNVGNSSIPIYNLNDGNTENTVTVPPDDFVKTSLLRWGNWDTVTGAVRWCGNSSNTGWGPVCGSVSEVPTGLASYANPLPATETLPASLVYSSKPNWWPSGIPWPPIGPDVMGGNLTDFNGGTLGGHAYIIPARACYNTMGGPADGTGPVRTFNRQTCYP